MATTLWAQFVGAALLPTVLLWALDDSPAGTAAAPAGQAAVAVGTLAGEARRAVDRGGSTAAQQQRRRCGNAGAAGGSLVAVAVAKSPLALWLADVPWASTLFLAQMCWLLVRTACMLWLPAS